MREQVGELHLYSRLVTFNHQPASAPSPVLPCPHSSGVPSLPGSLLHLVNRASLLSYHPHSRCSRLSWDFALIALHGVIASRLSASVGSLRASWSAPS